VTPLFLPPHAYLWIVTVQILIILAALLKNGLAIIWGIMR